jgi:hypothetical protein
VVADGVADDDEWASPVRLGRASARTRSRRARWTRSRPKSIKRDIPFALRRGTIGRVTTHALDAAQCAAEDEEELLALNRRAGGLGSLNSFFLLCMLISISLALTVAGGIAKQSLLTMLREREKLIHPRRRTGRA